MRREDVDVSEAVLVTHKGCMDGSGCALAFLHAGGKKENIVFVPAGMLEKVVKTDPVFQSDKFIIMADVGTKEKSCADTLEKRGNVILIDHHVGSQFLKGRPWCIIDAENGGTACGSELLRRWLQVDDRSVKELISVIDDHDRWKLVDPRSVDLATLSTFFGQKLFIENFKDRVIPTGNFFSPAEHLILQVLRERLEENIVKAIKYTIVKELQYGDKTTNVGYVFTNEQNTSTLLNRVLGAHPEIDVAVAVDFGKTAVGIRSRDPEHDVEEMARYFGGGGHKTASGHPLPPKFFDEVIDLIHP